MAAATPEETASPGPRHAGNARLTITAVTVVTEVSVPRPARDPRLPALRPSAQVQKAAVGSEVSVH